MMVGKRLAMTFNLIECCHNATERDDFIGICFEENKDSQSYMPKIIFPYGYHIESHDDILNLLTMLSNCQYEIDDICVSHANNNTQNGFPLQSYMAVIQDYLNHGYHHEREITYVSATSGKTNWRKTIAKEKPIMQKNGVIYTEMQVRKQQTSDVYLITEISKWCVYESFAKMGWYYKLPLLPKPNSFFEINLFISTIQDRLNKANKDSEKILFQSMLNILKNTNEQGNNPYNFRFGTRRFEKIWEYLVDKTFGTEHGENKKKYFPKSEWHFFHKAKASTNALYPDTIMFYQKNIYVIDAKYYRYGIEDSVKNLPNMSSIAKQITYAQYIYENKELNQSRENIHNIFILPFNKLNYENNVNNDDYHCIGYVDSNLSDVNMTYAKIYTILIDTKHLMKNSTSSNLVEIDRLSNMIEDLADSNNVLDTPKTTLL